MITGAVPPYSVGPLIGLVVNGLLALLCLGVFFAYRHYRPLKSLFLFYLTLSLYFLGFTIYGHQSSERAIIEGYRLMLLGLCFAPVAWVWFVQDMRGAGPGFWAWGVLVLAGIMAGLLLGVDHPTVMGLPLQFQALPRTWRPTSLWLKPVLFVFDLSVVLATLVFFWSRWWPASGKPAYVKAMVAGVGIWFLGGLHDAAYSMQFPFTLDQPVMWLGSVWLSLCLAVAIAYHMRGLEVSLGQLEDKFAKAFAVNPDGLTLSTREEGRYLEVNEAFLRFFGCRREEILGRAALDLGLWVQPEDRWSLLAQIERQGEARDLETQFRVRSGEIRDVLLSAQAITFDGQDCLLVVTSDITDKKRVEKALKESEQKYRFLSEGAGDALYLLRYDTMAYEYMSPVIETLTGYSAEEIKRISFGRIIKKITSPSSVELFRDDLRPARRAKDAAEFQADYLIGTKGGEDRWLSDHSRPWLDDKGDLLGSVGILSDITERKQAEERAAQTTERLQTLLDVASDGIHIHDMDGNLVESSESFRSMLGYGKQEAQSLNVADWDARFSKEELLRMFREQATRSMVFETVHRRRDGSEFPVEINWRGIEIGGKQCIYASSRDITERQRAAAEKAALEAQLSQAQKMEAVGTLAGGIAHDFNNILGAVLGYAEMARDDARSGQVNVGDLEQIILSAERAKKLIRQIMTFSRKVEPQRKTMDLNQEVLHSLEILRHTLPKMIAIKHRLASDLAKVNADSGQIGQVILNLATNAFQAMPEGGELTIVTENVSLPERHCRTCGETLSGPWVRFSVADTGQGIGPENLSKIFDPFFTTKKVGSGTGLGLSMVHGIVQGHKGHIECESQVGRGTVFTLHLPVQQLIDEGEGEGEEILEIPGGDETVLLVDDEEALRQMGQQVLSRAGYRVQTADSGEAALAMFSGGDGPPDLVVMDLGMPGMGGHRAMKAILRLNPGAKVLIASGYSIDDQVRAALESGAEGYVAKPYKQADLLVTVRNVLDGR